MLVTGLLYTLKKITEDPKEFVFVWVISIYSTDGPYFICYHINSNSSIWEILPELSQGCAKSRDRVPGRLGFV